MGHKSLPLSAGVMHLFSVGAVVAGLAMTGNIQAAEPNPKLKQAMQRDLNLRESQLSALLRIQDDSAAVERHAKRALGDRYAGTWVETRPDGSFRQVVAATASGRTGTRNADVGYRRVRYGMRTLERTQALLDRAFDARVAGISKPLNGLNSWHVDPRTNSVVVSMTPDAVDTAIDFVASTGVDEATIRFEIDEGVAQPLGQLIEGGGEYRFIVKNETFRCSIGFAITQGPHIGFATAAHCGAVNRLIYRNGEHIGQFIGVHNATDSAWAVVGGQHTMLPYVNDHGTFGQLIPVRGSVEAAIGAPVCRSGVTTGLKCGYITAKNVTAVYDDFGTIRGLTQSNACAGRGDSGGAWIALNDQAQGVTSGGNVQRDKIDNCGIPQSSRKTFFAPINPLLARYQLTLSTAP